MPKRIVIDCNIIISAAITDGNCRRLIRDIIKNHKNYISKEILLEYREVVNRPKFKAYKDRAVGLLEIICRESILVDLNEIEVLFELPDKSDEIYLRTAIVADADFLITGNLKDFPRKKYDHLRIVAPSEFMEIDK